MKRNKFFIGDHVCFIPDVEDRYDWGEGFVKSISISLSDDLLYSIECVQDTYEPKKASRPWIIKEDRVFGSRHDLFLFLATVVRDRIAALTKELAIWNQYIKEEEEYTRGCGDEA